MKQIKGALVAPFFHSAKGFSLVELMVVVAIIGLLSAVAIPNFQKFQAKSKTTEAKLQLAGIYTAEAAFFGSYDMYHICLNYMGYDPTEYQPSRYYGVGFNTTANIDSLPYSSAITSDLDTVACPQTMSATPASTYFLPGKAIGSAVGTVAHLPPTEIGSQAANAMTYTAGAGGIVHQNFTETTNNSAYTINQAKFITVIRNGY